tara:strand:- start:684 stop:1973 length:1290 start_codon:yes stop_codon:yes gene_type:complete
MAIDYIATYLKYTDDNECPKLFHRWTALSCLAAKLGRKVHFRFGHFNIYPNMYVLLIGSPGTKKSTGIKMGAKLLGDTGYDYFAAKKTRQEKYLTDLAEQFLNKGKDTSDVDLILDNLTLDEDYASEKSAASNKAPAESFVTADEFNNFIGYNNVDFISILGELWDYNGVFDYRLKNSDSIYINNPTINILGGNTQVGLNSAFPPEIIGQGFFSRLLLIYSDPSGKEIPFPLPPDESLKGDLVQFFSDVEDKLHGEMLLTDEARELMKIIYTKWDSIDDPRFEHYSNRRFQHLIKLTMVIAASKLSMQITKDVVIEANTVLTFAEQLMPRALGEFGRSKNSAATHKILVFITNKGMATFKEIFKVVSQDFDKREQVIEAINSLLLADKIAVQETNSGRTIYLPKKKVLFDGEDGLVDWKYLTQEELNSY